MEGSVLAGIGHRAPRSIWPSASAMGLILRRLLSTALPAWLARIDRQSRPQSNAPNGKASRQRRFASARNGNQVSIEIGSGSGSGRILLIGFDREHTTPIGRGENSGRTLTEANIVRSIRPVGQWSGSALKIVNNSLRARTSRSCSKLRMATSSGLRGWLTVRLERNRMRQSERIMTLARLGLAVALAAGLAPWTVNHAHAAATDWVGDGRTAVRLITATDSLSHRSNARCRAGIPLRPRLARLLAHARGRRHRASHRLVGLGQRRRRRNHVAGATSSGHRGLAERCV